MKKNSINMSKNKEWNSFKNSLNNKDKKQRKKEPTYFKSNKEKMKQKEEK